MPFPRYPSPQRNDVGQRLLLRQLGAQEVFCRHNPIVCSSSKPFTPCELGRASRKSLERVSCDHHKQCFVSTIVYRGAHQYTLEPQHRCVGTAIDLNFRSSLASIRRLGFRKSRSCCKKVKGRRKGADLLCSVRVERCLETHEQQI